MNRKISLLLLITLAALAAWSHSTLSVAADNRPSASGHGNVTVDGELRTFSFHAMTRQDGTVTGSVAIHNRDLDIFARIDINCLSVSGNTAVMSGVITNSNDPAFEGLRGIFRVVDNGEGSNDPVDQLTLIAVLSANSTLDCNDNFVGSLRLIEGGNIQVKP